MTKNEDVSWMPKPVGCSLKRFSTDELVEELATRDGVTKYPRWVNRDEVFGHRQTLDGRYTLLVVRE